MDLFEIHHIKNIPVIVLREDKRYAAPLPHHMKMGALEKICIEAKEDGYKTIGCFCTTHGIWPFGLPYLAALHGLKSIVCYPTNKIEKVPYQLLDALNSEELDFELKLFKPNMVSINGSQARKYIEEQGGYYVPFGVDHETAVETIANQFSVKELGTLIVPCGSGVTLAGVLRSIRQNKSKVEVIKAVAAHTPRILEIQRTIQKYEELPFNLDWRGAYDYGDIPDIECPWDAHPYYELKAYDWLYKNIERLPQPIAFLNIGSK